MISQTTSASIASEISVYILCFAVFLYIPWRAIIALSHKHHTDAVILIVIWLLCCKILFTIINF